MKEPVTRRALFGSLGKDTVGGIASIGFQIADAIKAGVNTIETGASVAATKIEQQIEAQAAAKPAPENTPKPSRRAFLTGGLKK